MGWTKHESVIQYDRVWERFTAPDGCEFWKDASTGKFWKNKIPNESLLLGYERKHPVEKRKEDAQKNPKPPLETDSQIGKAFKMIAKYTVERLKNCDDDERVRNAILRVNLSRPWKEWVAEQLNVSL